MSQQGARKAGKAAGAQPARQKHRSKSRNKIPKSVRYDLENALVGLCNVWFEDIKPHLLRNNIKVHVHPPSAGTGPEGDQPTGAPPAPPRCRHVNPGAAPDCPPRPNVNFADFCLTRPTASSAPSPRRRVSRRPDLPPLPSPPLSPPSQGPCHNCESDVCNKLRKCRKTRYTTTSTHNKSNLAVSNELNGITHSPTDWHPVVIPPSPHPFKQTLHLNLSSLKRVQKKKKTREKEVGSQTEWPVPYSICARRHRSCMRLESPRKPKCSAESHRKAVFRRNKSTQTDILLYVPLKTRSFGFSEKRRVRSPEPASPGRRVRSSSHVQSAFCVQPPSRVQSSSHVIRPSRRVQSSGRARTQNSRASATLRTTSPSRRNPSKTRVYEDICREEYKESAKNRDINIFLPYRSARMKTSSTIANTDTVLSVKVQRKKFNQKQNVRPGYDKQKNQC